MAGGMLPGVEAARWRRSHGIGQRSSSSSGGGGSGFTRRPVFCLYATSTETQLISRGLFSKGYDDRGMTRTSVDLNLGQLAREAKERLDERLLRTQGRSETRRNDNHHLTDERSSLSYTNGGDDIMLEGLQTEKKNRRLFTMRRTWGKLGVGRWKAAAGEEEE